MRRMSPVLTSFDVQAAGLGAALMARQKTGLGEVIASDGRTLAAMTLATLHQRSGLALMDAALAHDGAGEELASRTPLLAKLYEQHSASMKPHDTDPKDTGAKNAGTGNAKRSGQDGRDRCGWWRGAAGAHRHAAGNRSGGTGARQQRITACRPDDGVAVSVPEHADVAGAVGAAVGSVRQRVMISITAPADGRFRVHLPEGPIDLDAQEAALERAQAALLAHDRASSAGASAPRWRLPGCAAFSSALTNSCSSRPLSMPRQAASRADISIGQTVQLVNLSAQLLA